MTVSRKELFYSATESETEERNAMRYLCMSIYDIIRCFRDVRRRISKHQIRFKKSLMHAKSVGGISSDNGEWLGESEGTNIFYF